jgi:hypothetical protein
MTNKLFTIFSAFTISQTLFLSIPTSIVNAKTNTSCQGAQSGKEIKASQVNANVKKLLLNTKCNDPVFAYAAHNNTGIAYHAKTKKWYKLG